MLQVGEMSILHFYDASCARCFREASTTVPRFSVLTTNTYALNMTRHAPQRTIRLLSRAQPLRNVASCTRTVRPTTRTLTSSHNQHNHHNPAIRPSHHTTPPAHFLRRHLTTSLSLHHPPPPTSPSPLSEATYHALSDTYLNALLLTLEELAETDAAYEVEFSAGVLSLITPQGTYIINKQPPNKQIWLSSPVSGPKRFDWVEGADGGGGEELGVGDDGKGGRWVYLRDGTGLSEVLEGEVGVKVEGVAEREG